MLTSLERITLGRITAVAVTRATLGHIGHGAYVPIPIPPSIPPSVPGGCEIPAKPEKIVYTKQKERPDRLYAQALREDQEIIDIVVLLSMSEII